MINSIINLVPQRITITKLYLPWDAKTFSGFWAAWLLQIIGRSYGAFGFVGCDCLFIGFLHRAAAQFQILRYRLYDLTTFGELQKNGTAKNIEQWEKKKISDLIRQHQKIIELC